MKLFSYCIPIDDGAAPNPFWNVCTLTICKPVIRRVAEEGDWVVGVGSKNVGNTDYSGKLVYAMRINQKMSLLKYNQHCKVMLPEKIPDINSADYRKRVGDCIYEFEGDKPLLRSSVHGPENVDRDMRGINALLSDHFYYFGKAAITIPEEFSVIVRQGQGHQSTRNQFIKHKFVEWLQNNFEKNKIYGDPQITVEFSDDETGTICASERCISADEDEAIGYSDESLPLTHWSYFLALEADLKNLSRYIELHELNYSTFSIGLAQLFMAACSEIDVVLKQICELLSGKKLSNMGEYSKIIVEKLPIREIGVSIPIYNVTLFPFKKWNKYTKLDWWEAYNDVKHNRNVHYQKANLGNTLNALGALYILIFQLIRIHKGKERSSFSEMFVYAHLQPRQELFKLKNEDFERDIAEGKRTLWNM